MGPELDIEIYAAVVVVAVVIAADDQWSVLESIHKYNLVKALE